MSVGVGSTRAFALHPLNAVLLAGALPLFLGAALSDWAYAQSYQVQWANFASWLIFGAMVFTGFALLGALLRLLRRGRRGTRSAALAALLIATFIVGFIDALVHARDAWAMMPYGLILSIVAAALSLAAVCVGFVRSRQEFAL